MRLSPRSRNSVKHKSASVEFADQTGGRILTNRLEFNYKNRPKLLEARYIILRHFFMGLAKSLSLLAVSHVCLELPDRRRGGGSSRLGSCHSTFIKEVRH